MILEGMALFALGGVVGIGFGPRIGRNGWPEEPPAPPPDWEDGSTVKLTGSAQEGGYVETREICDHYESRLYVNHMMVERSNPLGGCKNAMKEHDDICYRNVSRLNMAEGAAPGWYDDRKMGGRN